MSLSSSTSSFSFATSHLVHNLSDPNATTATHCEEDSDGSTVVLGILMGVFGSIAINIGQNFQANGLQQAENKDKPCTSRLWVIGLSIFITGSLLNFVAFTFASASVLVPIEAIQFVVNVLFNKHVNNKEISSRMLTGVTLTVLGTVACVVFGPSDARCFLMDDLISFWTKPLWWVYLVMTYALAIAVYMLHERYVLAVKDGAPAPYKEYVMPISFALSSALLGGAQMIVHSKAIAELMELQLQLVEPFPLAHWFFWLELLILSATGIFWLTRMNKSLGLYDPLFIIPLLQSCYILFGVIAGGIFFEEFAGLHNGPAGGGAWPLFILGMLSILVGLALIAPPPSRESVPSPRLSRHDESEGVDGVELGDVPIAESTPHDDDGYTDQPTPLPTPSHRRGNSLGKGGLARVTRLSDLRTRDPEGQALVVGAVETERVPGHRRTASNASNKDRESVHSVHSSLASERLSALTTSEVVLSLAEGVDDGIAPVAEDLDESVSVRSTNSPRASDVATPASCATSSSPNRHCCSGDAGSMTASSHNASTLSSPLNLGTPQFVSPSMSTPGARFSEMSVADSEIGASIGVAAPNPSPTTRSDTPT